MMLIIYRDIELNQFGFNFNRLITEVLRCIIAVLHSHGTGVFRFPALNMARSISTNLFSGCRLAILILGIATLSLESFYGVKAQQTRPGRVNEQDPKNGDLETIRLGTRLVNVLFSVTDKENRYLKDLVKSDVSVLENGKL